MFISLPFTFLPWSILFSATFITLSPLLFCYHFKSPSPLHTKGTLHYSSDEARSSERLLPSSSVPTSVPLRTLRLFGLASTVAHNLFYHVWFGHGGMTWHGMAWHGISQSASLHYKFPSCTRQCFLNTFFHAFLPLSLLFLSCIQYPTYQHSPLIWPALHFTVMILTFYIEVFRVPGSPGSQEREYNGGCLACRCVLWRHWCTWPTLSPFYSYHTCPKIAVPYLTSSYLIYLCPLTSDC